ncbi:MAG TPA: DUF4956 domain-containing protein [Acetivibrio sp.]|uniref:DUF4956 domain-containing protein n=1 Tax=Acetivibrio sp. TaxID=1872092 RepID=UPI002CA4E9FE|nr:DUF4956 domain-containing protein [Acetivibrio sp.]HOM03628.1 DUF4956 domain-containing protein [Acetivibrio sp.]
MLDGILDVTTGITLSFGNMILTVVVSFVLGIAISLVHIKTHSEGYYSQNFALTLAVLPSIIAIIIMLIGSNIARAFSLAGTFMFIRFRSEEATFKDIAYVFFALAVGLACGIGFFGYAALFTLVLCAFLFAFGKADFGVQKSPYKQLKVTVREDLDYKREFEEVFNKYALSYELQKVKPKEYGAFYELVYNVSLYYDANEKEFLDALRCRNGNLNIVLDINTEG